MNRSRVIRRALALAAGAVLATGASLLIAAPASAHHPTIDGTAVCKDGTWTVTWTVGHSEDDIPALVTGVSHTPEDSELSGIADGDEIPAGGTLTVTQVVSGDATSASLTVDVLWERPYKEHTGTITGEEKLEGPCVQPTPSPEPTPTAVPSPSGTPVPGEGGGLPVTGTAVGGIVGAAALLLAAGLGLFVMARRRRIRFTA